MSAAAQPTQRTKVPVAVSPHALFALDVPASVCPHLAAIKHHQVAIQGALSRPATLLLDKFRDNVRCLLGNNARGHFPMPAAVPPVSADDDPSKKRKKVSQLELDIEWVQAVPFPACKICGDAGFARLHACLHCSFIGCFKHKHINAHLLDPANPHCFAVDYHQGAVFCIKCNDYIWDLDFERVLAGERVRMDALISKVKDATIKRSKNMEWSPTLEEAMKIQKFSSPLKQCTGLRGLSNLGSTCFMNVVLQTLIHNPLLRAHFMSDKHNQNLCRLKKAGSICMACEMDSLFTNCYSGETVPFSPTNFLYATWMSNQALARYAQQDAHEFFIAVLNEIHSNCSAANSKENLNCKCIIHQTFQGYLQSDVTCSHCRNVTTAKDPILDLSLNIKTGPAVKNGKKGGGSGSGGGGNTPQLVAGGVAQDVSCTLVECLERNFAAETLTHYQCSNPGCAKSTESVKHVTIKNLPPVLAIQLKRFEHSGQGSKVDTHVHIPTELDMTRFTTRSVQARMEAKAADKNAAGGVSGAIGSFDFLNDSVPEFRYSLFAVINHQGSLETGHYTAYVKSRNNWFLFDDHTVTLATQKDVLGAKVYMCFYVRENFCFSPSNDPGSDANVAVNVPIVQK
ncbi:hypothetical protein BDR26DRAFT_859242 [Obelidium mucronatum]|nr:hypothetical protein BDR26DRAFT_859242 [Obelidium mucronatum]